MLNLLFRLQQLEAEERSIAAERINSQEYKQLRAIKAAFDAKKQQYLRLSEDIASLAGELETFPARLAEAERRLAAEQTAIYDGSVSSSKALAARESQAASLAESLSELRSLQAAYEGEQAQKQAQILVRYFLEAAGMTFEEYRTVEQLVDPVLTTLKYFRKEYEAHI